MTSNEIRDLFKGVVEDPWRRTQPFEASVDQANRVIFGSESSEEKEQALLRWIQKNQPCVFGQFAARNDGIVVCVVSEEQCAKGDAAVQEYIQEYRRLWWRRARLGESSNFIILLASQKLAASLPSRGTKGIASRLLQLYLLEDQIQFDRIYHERVFLDIPGRATAKLMWLAGVNYFSAHGDGRWWKDHRIPGGIGFSINSVGHFIRSQKLRSVLPELVALANEAPESVGPLPVDSPGAALVWAMNTINNASGGVHEPATFLRSVEDPKLLPVVHPPTQLPVRLDGKDFCTYEGYYHTDETLPSTYFLDAVDRPVNIRPVALDFTYLFYDNPSNPAYNTMTRGVRIAGKRSPAMMRATKMQPVEVDISGDNFVQQMLGS